MTLILAAPDLDAATITATDCSFAAVQAAVRSASAGTTVLIPAGNGDWGSSQLVVPGGIALKGAGRTATTIRRTQQVSQTAFLIKFDGANGLPSALSDLTLMGYGDIFPNPPIANADKGVGLINGCVDFTITNCKFTRFVFAAVEIVGSLRQRGVISGNEFINNYNNAVRNLGYGVAVYGDGTWPALELGTRNAVFIEDNYMSGNRHHVASNNSARYVFRHNTVIATDATKDFAMTDVHGLSSWPTGGRSYEIYENDFSANLSSGAVYTAVGIRGGDGVIFNNTISAKIAYPIILTTEGFSRSGTYPGPYQVRAAWIWNNNLGTIRNSGAPFIQLGRDYFTTAKTGYVPFTYPHPLRAAAIAPTISTQPQSRTVTVGQTASFSVVATGSPAPTYQWQKNAANIAGATTANYTTPATSAADHGATFRVVVSNSAGSLTSNVATLTVTSSGLVGGDIGSVGKPGSASESAGTWTVTGSGTDIWNTADGFNFVRKAVVGDVRITARVNAIGNTNAWAKAGVMVRESTAAGSRHAFACVTPGNGVAFQRRLASNAASLHTAGPKVTAPYWVRLERIGNTLIGSCSTNGSTWTEVRRDTVSMSATVQVGLAVTSHAHGTACTATFSHVEIVSTPSASN